MTKQNNLWFSVFFSRNFRRDAKQTWQSTHITVVGTITMSSSEQLFSLNFHPEMLIRFWKMLPSTYDFFLSPFASNSSSHDALATVQNKLRFGNFSTQTIARSAQKNMKYVWKQMFRKRVRKSKIRLVALRHAPEATRKMLTFFSLYFNPRVGKYLSCADVCRIVSREMRERMNRFSFLNLNLKHSGIDIRRCTKAFS